MLKFTLLPLVAALRSPRWPLALAGAVVPGLALGAPSGGTVVGGQATIGGSGGNVVVNQTSNAAIINWQQFSVGSNEYVQFNQSSSSAAVLNRVVGGNASEILGNISANGRVFIINPNGVMFGQGAKVDVGGLVASTLNISDSDFMQGRYVMTGSPSGTAGVSNAGRITAADGGFVVLAGSSASNSGLIQARLGTVALASGSAVTLGLDAQGLVDFSVDAKTLAAAAGVENLGSIVADGGSVVMSAQTARGLIGNAVNNSGTVRARSIGEHEGSVYLLAEGGDILQDGVIDASGASGTNGGTVSIKGDGNILLSGNSRITATGDSGGDVRVIATGTTTYAKGAKLDVSRKTASGSGGFAELSGFGHLRVEDLVTVGDHGRLLFDPTDMIIGSSTGATMSETQLETQLRSMGQGSIFSLEADRSITFEKFSDGVLDGTNAQSSGYGGGLDIRITGSASDAFIKFNDLNDIIKAEGPLSVYAGGSYGGTVSIGKLISGDDIAITSRGQVTTGDLTSSGGGIQIESYNGGVTTGKLTSGDTLSISARNNIDVGDILVTDGSVDIDSSAGRIDADKIEVKGFSSTQFDGEGSSAYVYAGIALSAYRGIQTGDLKLTLTGDETNASQTYLNGFIFLDANSSPVEGGPNADLVTGRIDVSVGAAQGVTGDVQATADVFLTNGVDAEGDGIPSANTSGGSITTGPITIKTRGTASLQDSAAAQSHLILAADGKINVQGNQVTVESASSDGSDQALAQFFSYFDSVVLGNVSMAGADTWMQAFATLQQEGQTASPVADVTVGSIQGAKYIDLYASRNVTTGYIQPAQSLTLFAGNDLLINAGTQSILLGSGGTPSLRAGNRMTLKGNDIQLSGSIDAQKLVIEANGDVTAYANSYGGLAVAESGYTFIDVGGLSVAARSIDLRDAAIYVGSESMDLGKDPGLLSKVPQALRPLTDGPNAAFVASEGVQLGEISIDGGYLFVKAPSIAPLSISSERPIFYNYRPFADTANFSVVPANLQSDIGITFALGGTGYRGNITVDQQQNTVESLALEPKELSDTNNYLFLTQGRVDGAVPLSATTSGQVLVLDGITGPQEPEDDALEQAQTAQTAISQMQTFKMEGGIGFEVSDTSDVEEVSDSPDELECR
ncbi:filamentous hemagglutinin N-terminal domain-containing protein [Solimonas sp. SE-A11]|uniref:two-partner secretion domain-containing protein n=1 Tax=Solimonas sp. SE-A11 TaxID=3054954 RepID=UPI00259C90C0|nr:filamentous hemagglutinin N-terminal domain-containing protein [Solimonas sp. SE-A11]MDM4769329.1 filamentous hemagglutinin N-terminal domain-containing protein [Solimonas sp. SE-A11]